MTHDLENLPPTRDGIFRRGFGLKSDILGELNADYHSEIVERIRQAGNQFEIGGLKLRLAEHFGFCYGVDKAIDFAYETRRRFPDRRIFLTTEIIHNPRVNRRMLEMGIRFLSGQYAEGLTFEDLTAEDVILIPAFGVSTAELERLKKIGCILVDTTCGSVVHVWKRVERYAKDGYTAIIHGKYRHEETIATSSYATSHGGHYLVVFNHDEAKLVCDFIRTGQGAEELTRRFAKASSEGFDFEKHLVRAGVANQTTMLSSESLEIADRVRDAMIERWGEDSIDEHFRSFDTICGATQERQDAVLDMMKDPPDLMLIVGGFNSSNTGHLSEISAQFCPSYHVDDPSCLISPEEIRHKPPHIHAEPVVVRDWLPARRPLTIGLTAGASTPNKVIGEVIERLAAWEEAR